MNSELRTVTVIGAGIVGVSCGIHLQRLGFEVTIVDSQQPGEGCSFGNAGVIAPCAIVPVNAPGMLSNALRMLLNPLGPLALRWSYLPKMLPWLFSYIYNSREAKSDVVSVALASITNNALKEHQLVASADTASDLIKPSPYLYAYESVSDFEKDKRSWSVRSKHGIKTKVLLGEEVQRYEPTISSKYQCAVVIEDGHAFTPNPSLLVKSLAKDFQDNGGIFVQAEVKSVNLVNNSPSSLTTSHGVIETDILVVAAGIFSTKFAAQLGEPVPLESERGYHITIKDSGITPNCPIMNASGKFVVTPMTEGLRFAGLVEFGGAKANPNYDLCKRLLRQASIMFPEINLSDHTQWMGHRPAMPDSLPVIGPSSTVSNTYYAFGHHHIGLTTGPKTGRLIAETIAGQKLDTDLTPFSISRYKK